MIRCCEKIGLTLKKASKFACPDCLRFTFGYDGLCATMQKVFSDQNQASSKDVSFARALSGLY